MYSHFITSILFCWFYRTNAKKQPLNLGRKISAQNFAYTEETDLVSKIVGFFFEVGWLHFGIVAILSMTAI